MKSVMRASRGRPKRNKDVNYKDPGEEDLKPFRKRVWEVQMIRKIGFKFSTVPASVIIATSRIYRHAFNFREMCNFSLSTGMMDPKRMVYVFDDLEKMTKFFVEQIEREQLSLIPCEGVLVDFDVSEWTSEDRIETMNLLLTFAKHGLAPAYRQGVKMAAFFKREPEAAYQILFDSYKKDRTWHGIPCLIEFNVDHIRDHAYLRKLIEEFACEPLPE